MARLRERRRMDRGDVAIMQRDWTRGMTSKAASTNFIGAGSLNAHLEPRTSTNALGDMDRALSYIHGDQRIITAPVEGKSTQNLLLPINAADIVVAYNFGYATMVSAQSLHSKQWCHVCHPVAQLFRQMKNNNLRFGVLTSATRTYF
eukprot:scaffold25567_cov49-Attheya_sp.AAC.1